MSAAEFKDIGNKHLQAGEFDLAIENYTKAIELDGSNHVFYSNRSAAYLSKGDATNALADGKKCTEVNPSWAKGYSRHGAALHALKKYDEAVSVYKQGLEIAPTDAGLLGGLDEVNKAKTATAAPSNPLGGLFSPQMMAKLAGNPKFAAKMQNPQFKAKLAMMQTNPQMMMQDPEMMEVLQAMLGGMGGMPSAPGAGDEQDEEDDVEDVHSKFSPTPPSTYAQPSEAKKAKVEEPAAPVSDTKRRAEAAKARGNDLYKAKQLDEALAAYDEAISIDPTNILYNNNKAAVLIEKGDFDGAIHLCESVLESYKQHRPSYEDRAKVYQRIAAAHLKKKDIAAAIKAYEKSQMETHDRAIQSKIKNLELDLKKQLKEAYIDPVKGAEAKERGNEFFRAGDFPGAIKEYEDAVKRDPTSAAYCNNLAAALVKIMDFNGAKVAVEKSLKNDPKYVKAWAKKGDIEFFMKEYHKSIESYQKGLQLEPGNASCMQGLAKTQRMIHTQDDDPDRAQRGLADPAIQAILSDPVIRNVLNDAQSNPSSIQHAMKDVHVRAKIEKLIAAGVLKVG